ncbi:MAG: twin-arginine translocase subunit TatC, partial [Paramuribaculum sp.]|nr:twin-arginine translocase subunit TatC [Paramuribaculum sp.]
GRAGVLTRAFFSRFRRHAIAGLLILAAVITPTGDPFTLMVVFLPVYMLWELSGILVPSSSDDDADGDDGSDADNSGNSGDLDSLYIPSYRRSVEANNKDVTDCT